MRGDAVVMVESVTASRAAGIIVVVLGRDDCAVERRTSARQSERERLPRHAERETRATGKLRTPRTKGE
jgi:hypothetical protein